MAGVAVEANAEARLHDGQRKKGAHAGGSTNLERPEITRLLPSQNQKCSLDI